MTTNLSAGRLLAVLGGLIALLGLALFLRGGAEPAPDPTSQAGSQAEGQGTQEVVPAVRALGERGLEVAQRFEAPGGLIGYTGRAGGRELVVYATPDGQHVLLGTLLDAEGNNLSQQHLADHLSQPDLAEAWERLASAEWIATGARDPERVVYMFTDPYCPYCNAIWRASRPYYEEGLQIRHLLVGVIRPKSADKAAAILQAEDPAAAFRAHQEAYGQSDGQALPDELADAAREAVTANNRLMSELGVGGTPAVVYKTADGTVKMANGMPKLSRLADIYRLPEQTVDDPALDRFR